MSAIADILLNLLAVPFGVAFWAFIISMPVGIFLNGRARVVTSLLLAVPACWWFIMQNNSLAPPTQIALVIATPLGAFLVYLWWLGRRERLKVSHG